jgi:7,8-dihydropterin-6-yl-methyl-4-(beta-D-ribofuranosyl)aminobenzene 5'-phosphate synthase
MLFRSCDCITRSPYLSRRGFLCAGGAGFVSAMVGTLIGSGRTAQA